MDLWYRLQKKYGDSYEAITAYLEQAQQQADELAQLESNIAKTKQLLAQQKGEWEQQAQSLSQLRAKDARRLASKVTAHIHLSLIHISFGKFVKTGAVRHSRGDSNNICILFS